MITREKACIIAYHHFPELERKRWVKVIDGLPQKFTLFDFEVPKEEIWCIQYSGWDKESGMMGPHSSNGIFISKESGEILFKGNLSDE